MTDYYFDASALVKQYADEPGSSWTRQVSDPPAQDTILLAEITLAEVAAALSAKHRAPSGITQQQRDRALSRFLQDCDEHFLLLPVDRLVIDRAVELTQNHLLPDTSLHLVCGPGRGRPGRLKVWKGHIQAMTLRFLERTSRAAEHVLTMRGGLQRQQIRSVTC